MGESAVFWIIIAIIIFFVVREIMLWYWKINKIVENQDEQIKLLEEILYSMNPKSEYFKADEEEKDESTS